MEHVQNKDRSGDEGEPSANTGLGTMRAELIGHVKPCMTDIYIHIDARMADYIRTHLYVFLAGDDIQRRSRVV